MRTIHIGIVDDQTLFRSGIIHLLENQDNFQVVLSANDGEDCIQQLSEANIVPDVLLLDLEMSGMDGIELNAWLRIHYPEIKILVLSVHNKDKLIAKLISSGAHGYLIKDCDEAYLIKAILSIYDCGFFIDAHVLKAIQNATLNQSRAGKLLSGLNIDLSQREQQVLELICKEFNSNEIADRLFISIRTVEGHRNSLLLKTGCHNTAGLVIFAIKYNFVQIEL